MSRIFIAIIFQILLSALYYLVLSLEDFGVSEQRDDYSLLN
jgi:hypothetical protein